MELSRKWLFEDEMDFQRGEVTRPEQLADKASMKPVLQRIQL